MTYPIAALKKDVLMGGRNAGLSSPRRWDFNIADYYMKGGFDGAIFYDSEGRKFKVVKIMLSPSQWWYYLGDLAGNFFLPRKVKTSMANVDMELKQIGKLSLDQFSDELRSIALANPSWWKRHSSEKEIREMFKGCATFAAAIDDIGVLDSPGKERLKGRSDVIVDLRQ
ncbi:MAG TPA: hypothetical protein VLA52_00935 [Thermohalobaculum sp.]|nr:hypothetical protein [Thermohalobaculum sp.]